jgi:hypothetical protein
MRAILTLSLFVALTPTVGADEINPSIFGAPDKITPANADAKKFGTIGSFLVAAPKDVKSALDKAIVRVTEKTKLRKMNGNLEEEATFADVKTGCTVSVWFTGPVLESYPVQATAGKVLIFPAADGKNGKSE